MAGADDEIPDLFPGAPRAGGGSVKVPRPAEVRQSQRPPTPVDDQSDPDELAFDLIPSSPPPANPAPWSPPRPKAAVTQVMGTADELEFDPLSERGAAVDLGFPGPAQEKRESQRPVGEIDLEGPIEQLRAPILERRAETPPFPAAGEMPDLAVPAVAVSDVDSLETSMERMPRVPSPERARENPGPNLDAFPGMGGEVELGGGLDDLDFSDAGQAQLNVAIPMADRGDDTPWPVGETPHPGDFDIEPERIIEVSGFGPPPTGFFQSPLYALRVFSALRPLREKGMAAELRLRELEGQRDERLAELATEKRPALEGLDRFMGLYSKIDRHDENIVAHRQALQSADLEGAQALRAVEAGLETLAAARLLKQRVRDEQKSIFDETERAVARANAALSRVKIENRNLERKAAKIAEGNEIPEGMETLYEGLEESYARAEAQLKYAKTERVEVKKLFDAAEDELRLAVANQQRKVAEKESLLMTYEGDVAAQSRSLDEALVARRTELADVARALISLRGEVPVAQATRRELIASDMAVGEAARYHETLMRALASMDKSAFEIGRAIWLAAASAVVVLVFWAVFS